MSEEVILFPKVKGLYYFREIITKEEEQNIIDYLYGIGKFKPVTGGKREVQQYGYNYSYFDRKTNDESVDDIPDILLDLIEKIPKEYRKDEFVQCIVNKYEPSEGISAHIDASVFGDVIACFTINSGATMTFSNKEEEVDVYTEPRSLYIMTGDSRWKWRHEMRKRKSDIVNGVKIIRDTRISITFRSIKKKN